MPQRRRADNAPKRNPIRETIAARAYERFCARGGEHGKDLDDWLAAERELVVGDLDWTDYLVANAMMWADRSEKVSVSAARRHRDTR